MKNLHAHMVIIWLNQDDAFYINVKGWTIIGIQGGIL